MPDFNIIKFEKLDSTNLFALREFESLPDGTVILAGMQTAGRGRMGRHWLSEGKGIYFTVVLKNAARIEYYAAFSHLMAISVCEALEHCGLSPQVKWPNDVLCSGPFHHQPGKICGMLSQAASGPRGILGIALGCGINYSQTAADFGGVMYPAVSVRMLADEKHSESAQGGKSNTGKENPVAEENVQACDNGIKSIDSAMIPGKQGFLEMVLEFFFKRKRNFEEKGFASIYDEYIQRCHFLGKEIKISANAGIKPAWNLPGKNLDSASMSGRKTMLGNDISADENMPAKYSAIAKAVNMDGTLTIIRNGHATVLAAADILP